MSDQNLYRPSNDNPYLASDTSAGQASPVSSASSSDSGNTRIRPSVQPQRIAREAHPRSTAPDAATVYRRASESDPLSSSFSQARDPEAARIAHDAQLAAGYGYEADDSDPATHHILPGMHRKQRDQVRAGATRSGRRPISRRRLRFWRWFRAWPITLMLLLAAATIILNSDVGAYAMRIFYPVKYAETISRAASAYGVDEDLVAAVIRTESSWKADAESSVGAQGLMQIMPDTADFLIQNGYVSSSWSPDNLLDPETNIQFGCAYLAYLEKTTGSQEETLAAYNAGPSVAAEWAKAPSEFTDAISYPETKLYVSRVQSAYTEYAKLYPDGLTNFSLG